MRPSLLGIPTYENPVLPKDAILLAPPGTVEFHPTTPVVIVGKMAIATVKFNLDRAQATRAAPPPTPAGKPREEEENG